MVNCATTHVADTFYAIAVPRGEFGQK